MNSTSSGSQSAVNYRIFFAFSWKLFYLRETSKHFTFLELNNFSLFPLPRIMTFSKNFSNEWKTRCDDYAASAKNRSCCRHVILICVFVHSSFVHFNRFFSSPAALTSSCFFRVSPADCELHKMSKAIIRLQPTGMF